MKKLRILSVIFVLLMGMFAVACVGNDPADSTEAETTKQNEPDVTTDETDTKATEETEEVTTEQTTEEVTEPETDPYENLPTEISLPAEYEASDIVYECDDGSVVYTYRERLRRSMKPYAPSIPGVGTLCTARQIKATFWPRPSLETAPWRISI